MNRALIVLAAVAVVLLLREAKPFMLPLTIAVFLSFMLSPMVDLLGRRLPRPLAAIFVTLGFAAMVATGALQLTTPLEGWMQRVPEAMTALERHVADVNSRLSSLTDARESLQRMAERMAGGGEDKVAVEIEEDPTSQAARHLGGVASGFAMAVLLLYFLLATGNVLTHRLVRLPRDPQRRRRYVRVVRSLRSGVAHYLATITVMNIGLALATTAGMYWLGVPDPWLWGILGGLLNYIPYVGTIITVAAITVAALVSQPTMADILAPGALYLLLNGIEATILTPTVLGGRFSVNPLFVFLAIIALGWLWGVGGMFIAVPLLVFTKEVLTHLGGNAPRLARLIAR